MILAVVRGQDTIYEFYDVYSNAGGPPAACAS